MFTQIRTSKANKELVSQLTRRLNLGAENVIARLAFSYSIAKGEKLDVSNLADSSGKTYSKAVLFGKYYDIYMGMLCTLYNLYKTDQDLPKYVKLHIDNGLDLIYQEVQKRPNVDGFDFLTEKIGKGIQELS